MIWKRIYIHGFFLGPGKAAPDRQSKLFQTYNRKLSEFMLLVNQE